MNNNTEPTSDSYNDLFSFLESEDEQILDQDSPEEQPKNADEPIKSQVRRGHVRDILGKSGAMLELEDDGQLVCVTNPLFPRLTLHAPLLLYGDGEPEHWSLIPPEARRNINGIDIHIQQAGIFRCQSIEHNAKRLLGVFTPDDYSQSISAWIAFDNLALPLPSDEQLIINATLRVKVALIDKNDTLRLTQIPPRPGVLKQCLTSLPKKRENQLSQELIPTAVYAVGRILENQTLFVQRATLEEKMEKDVYLPVDIHRVVFALHRKELSWYSEVDLEQLAPDGKILVHCGPFDPVHLHIAVQCITANDPEAALIKKHYPLDSLVQGLRIKHYTMEGAILVLEHLESDEGTLYVEGLIPNGEHGWGNMPYRGSAVKGVIEPLRVIGYDDLRGTPIFSHRQALPNPWTTINVGDLKVGECYEAQVTHHRYKKFEQFYNNKLHPWFYVEPLRFPGFAIECRLPDYETYEAIISTEQLLTVYVASIDPNTRRILGELTHFSEKKLELGATIEVFVYERIKGGYHVVDTETKRLAFLPQTQMINPNEIDPDSLVKQTILVKVIQENKGQSLAIVSQKAERTRYAGLAKGQIVTGTVKKIVDYGAFVQLESGIDGLLHKNELVYRRIQHASEILSVGQEIQIKIIAIDVERGRINLSLKQLLPDPWEEVASRFYEGTEHLGKVTHIEDYGAFLELSPGIEGLLHNSKIDWKGGNHNQAREQLEVGQELLVGIKNLDIGKHRIDLTRIPLLEKEVNSKFPEGAEPLGKVTHLTQFGAFIELSPGIEGLLYNHEIAYGFATGFFAVGYTLKAGDTLKVHVKDLDLAKKHLGLSVCPTYHLPDETKLLFPKGSEHEGQVVALLADSAVIQLSPNLRGLLLFGNNTTVNRQTAKTLDLASYFFEVGQLLRVAIKKITDERITLTIQPFLAKSEKVVFLDSEKFRSLYERATSHKEVVACQALATELTTELEKVPDSVELRRYLAEVLSYLGNDSQALTILQQGIKLTPYEQALSQHAVSLARQLGNLSLAREIAQNALNGPLEKPLRQEFKSFFSLETPKETEQPSASAPPIEQEETRTVPETYEADWKWKQNVYGSAPATFEGNNVSDTPELETTTTDKNVSATEATADEDWKWKQDVYVTSPTETDDNLANDSPDNEDWRWKTDIYGTAATEAAGETNTPADSNVIPQPSVFLVKEPTNPQALLLNKVVTMVETLKFELKDIREALRNAYYSGKLGNDWNRQHLSRLRKRDDKQLMDLLYSLVQHGHLLIYTLSPLCFIKTNLLECPLQKQPLPAWLTQENKTLVESTLQRLADEMPPSQNRQEAISALAAQGGWAPSLVLALPPEKRQIGEIIAHLGYNSFHDALNTALNYLDSVGVPRQGDKPTQNVAEDWKWKQDVYATSPAETDDNVSKTARSENSLEPPDSKTIVLTHPEREVQTADFVIITALREELEAVLSKLTDYHPELDKNCEDSYTRYIVKVPTAHRTVSRVVIACPITKEHAAIMTTTLLKSWQPRHVLFVGIAAGIPGEVNLGDVLIAKTIVSCNLEKNGEPSQTGIVTHLIKALYSKVSKLISHSGTTQKLIGDSHPTDAILLKTATHLPTDWHQLIQTQRPDSGKPESHLGVIISTNHVIKDEKVRDNYVNRWNRVGNVIGIENGGTTTAIHRLTEQFLMIKAVSDFADKNSPEVKKWRAYACEVAASYTIAFLTHHHISD
jgi:ribosomal protein S1/nucleoside phosphorylase